MQSTVLYTGLEVGGTRLLRTYKKVFAEVIEII
jgi:hypothetical protein